MKLGNLKCGVLLARNIDASLLRGKYIRSQFCALSKQPIPFEDAQRAILLFVKIDDKSWFCSV